MKQQVADAVRRFVVATPDRVGGEDVEAALDLGGILDREVAARLREEVGRDVHGSAVRVSQGAIGGDPVAHALLELLQLRESAFGGAGPDGLAVEGDLEDAFVAGPERDFRELALERREELLRHPRRAEEPAAARAVCDLDARHAVASSGYGLICTGVPSGTARQSSSISALESATQPLVQSLAT